MATTYHRGDVYRTANYDPVYSTWCVESTPSTATTTHAIAWTEWTCTNSTSTTPISTSAETWYHWTTADTGAVGEYQQAQSRVHRQGQHAVIHHRAEPLTEDQRRERERRAELRQREHEEARRKEAVATERANELLHAHLTDAQRSDLARDGFFFVDSLRGNKYRIRRGRVGNVDAMHQCGEKVSHRLCAHPQLYVPDGDTMLAQKLMLEHNEDEFLRLANRS